MWRLTNPSASLVKNISDDVIYNTHGPLTQSQKIFVLKFYRQNMFLG